MTGQSLLLDTPTIPKRRSRFGLLPRIVVAIVLGVVIGQFITAPVTRGFLTFNALFSAFLGFLIPLIIVGLVTPAIAELGRGAGKWLGITTAIAYISTIASGLLALAVSWVVLPRLLAGDQVGALDNPENSALSPYFSIAIPPVFGVMTALVLAFCVGIGLTLVGKGTMHEGFVEFRAIIVRIIGAVIIPLLPIYIFGMFLGLTANGQIWKVVTTFAQVIVMVFILTVVVLLAQYTIAGAIARKNPFRMLATMMPAYATALGTSSSAATIPVTLGCTRRLGVPDTVASFSIPLCATIHLAGSTLKITSFSVAIMIITGMPLHLGQLIGFVAMLGITMIAAPGVPGGAIMAAAGILGSMLGFDDTAVGLMIASYIAIDSFGTATNVTGDGAIAVILSRLIPSPDVLGQAVSEDTAAAQIVAAQAETTAP